MADEGTLNCIDILLAIILPPLGVFFKFGCKVRQILLFSLFPFFSFCCYCEDLNFLISIEIFRSVSLSWFLMRFVGYICVSVFFLREKHQKVNTVFLTIIESCWVRQLPFLAKNWIIFTVTQDLIFTENEKGSQYSDFLLHLHKPLVCTCLDFDLFFLEIKSLYIWPLGTAKFLNFFRSLLDIFFL